MQHIYYIIFTTKYGSLNFDQNQHQKNHKAFKNDTNRIQKSIQNILAQHNRHRTFRRNIISAGQNWHRKNKESTLLYYILIEKSLYAKLIAFSFLTNLQSAYFRHSRLH